MLGYTTGPPVAERYRRLMDEQLQAAHTVFIDLLNKGIIRPGSGKWASTFRPTGDYHSLNAIMIPDRYPLPIIENLLQNSPGNVFSPIDLREAFYQIPIDEDSIEKTAVTTPFGLNEFLGTSLGRGTRRKQCNEEWITLSGNYRLQKPTWTTSS